MTAVVYKPKGKGSRAWWLQAIKWFGQDSIKGVMLGVQEKYPQATRAAVADLVAESYVKASGPTGRGLTPTYILTELGEGYLSRNQEDLQETAEEPAAAPPAAPEKAKPVYTWKKVLGGAGIRYFMDGKMIAPGLMPDDELLRIRTEINAGGVASAAPETAEPEVQQGDVYTWKQPQMGPCQYFLNGEFILETKVPRGELKRMLTEQGSPLANIAQPHSYWVKVLEDGSRAYYLNDNEIPRSEVPENLLDFLDNWEPPKDGDPRLKPTKRPKNPDDLDDELGDEPGRSIPKPKVSNPRPLDRVVDRAITLGQEIEKHHARKISPPAKQGPEAPTGLDISEPPKISPPTPPPTEPVNAAPAARKLFSQADFAELFRDALVEVLLERYADQVTAGEVLQKLQERADG